MASFSRHFRNKTIRIPFVKLKVHPGSVNVSHFSAFLFIALFASFGTYALLHGFAATAPIASAEAENMTLSAGANVVADSTASGGKAVQLTSNGSTLDGSVVLPGNATSVNIIARGSKCKRVWPTMNMTIDGASVLSSVTVNSTSWRTYSANVTLSNATHTLHIQSPNSNNCRNLYVDTTLFFGPAIATPAPTVSFSGSPSSINSGSASTLTWATTDATSCSASGAWNGTEPTNGSASTGSLNSNATYSLQCTGSGGTASASTTVTVTTTTPTTTSTTVKGFGVSVPCDRICYQTAAQKDEEFADIAATGAKWVRIDLRWAVVEDTGPTATNWSAFDDTVDRAIAHGLNVLPVVHSTPDWANGAIGERSPPTNISDWSNFLTKATTHEKSRLHFWEIWNEENTADFFNGTVAQYTKLLIAANDAIKAVDPSAMVMTGGTSPQGDTVAYATSTVSWLQGIYANGGGGHFDIVATHPYPWGGTNSNDTGAGNAWYQMFGTTPSLRSVMVSNGDGAKPIWGTEWGYNLTGYLPAPSESAIQTNIKADAANWKTYSWSGVLFWYTDRDDDVTGGFGLSNSSYPLVHKPRWATFQASVQ